jgi:hypothetical protein
MENALANNMIKIENFFFCRAGVDVIVAAVA